MGKKIIRVAPSLLASDFTNLDKDITKIIKANADWLHLDIMDGNFVNNISFGMPILEAIQDYPIFKDVHLMINNPLNYIKRIIDLKADLITFHYEAISSKRKIWEIINTVHDYGLPVGIAIKPDTKIDVLLPFLAELDLVLIMSVEPGFGGQKFMENSLEKVSALRKIIDENDYETLIEVDGGINNENAILLNKKGADVLVAGSYIFKNESYSKAIKSLKKFK